MTRTLCILGSGPVGLDCALAAVEKGYHVTVIDKAAAVGGSLPLWGPVKLLTPHLLNVSNRMAAVAPGLDMDAVPTGDEFKEQVLEVVERHLKEKGVSFCMNTRASAIRPHGSEDGGHCVAAVQAEGTDGSKDVDLGPFRYIVDCTGTYGHWQDEGSAGTPAVGEDQAKREHRLLTELPPPSPDCYTGKSIVVATAPDEPAAALGLGAGWYGKAGRITWITSKPPPKPAAGALHAHQLAAKAAAKAAKPGQNSTCAVEHVTGTISEVQDKYVVVAPPGPSPPVHVPCDVGFDLRGKVSVLPARLVACYTKDKRGPLALAVVDEGGGGGDLAPQFFVVGAKNCSEDPNLVLTNGYVQVDRLFHEHFKPPPKPAAGALHAHQLAAKAAAKAAKPGQNSTCAVEHVTGTISEVQDIYVVVAPPGPSPSVHVPCDVGFDLRGKVSVLPARLVACYTKDKRGPLALAVVDEGGGRGDGAGDLAPQFFVVGAKNCSEDPNLVLRYVQVDRLPAAGALHAHQLAAKAAAKAAKPGQNSTCAVEHVTGTISEVQDIYVVVAPPGPSPPVHVPCDVGFDLRGKVSVLPARLVACYTKDKRGPLALAVVDGEGATLRRSSSSSGQELLGGPQPRPHEWIRAG
ncbi:hypothetical protein DIPPA_14694 [Diplonema papillatum]|nr:hypothetical protein DIPPA_14694 [Diplonema papillatum]